MADLKVNSIADAADSGPVSFPQGLTGAITPSTVAATGAVSGTTISSTSGNVASAAQVVAATGVVATTGGVTASAGNIAASAGAVSASTTVTAGTNVVATAGSVSAGTTVTATMAVIGATGQMSSITNTAGTGAPDFPQGLTLPYSEIVVNSDNGYGSTATKRPRFTNVESTSGTYITRTDDATDATRFTVNRTGVYGIYLSITDSVNAAATIGITRNSSDTTVNVDTLPAAEVLAICSVGAAGALASVSCERKLTSGDVIAAQTYGNGFSGFGVNTKMSICWLR